MPFHIQPMSEAAAQAVLSWRYEPPYDFYDARSDDPAAEIAHFMDPQNAYFAITDGSGEIIGHCCYGAEAQVPNGDYSAAALDVGVGMHPDWTGKGYGAAVIAAVLEYGREQFQPQAFRASVAAWNERSLRACIRNGFYENSRFHNPQGVEFILLLCALS